MGVMLHFVQKSGAGIQIHGWAGTLAVSLNAKSMTYGLGRRTVIGRAIRAKIWVRNGVTAL